MVHCPQEDNGTTVYMLVIVMNFANAKSQRSTKSNWNVSFVCLSRSHSFSLLRITVSAPCTANTLAPYRYTICVQHNNHGFYYYLHP